MTDNSKQGSARIYEFRPRGLTGSTSRPERSGAVVQLASRRAPRVDFDAWYHQEALLEAEGATKQ
jgi:hypothetical protein